jgi:hypothetical protein
VQPSRAAEARRHCARRHLARGGSLLLTVLISAIVSGAAIVSCGGSGGDDRLTGRTTRVRAISFSRPHALLFGRSNPGAIVPDWVRDAPVLASTRRPSPPTMMGFLRECASAQSQ